MEVLRSHANPRAKGFFCVPSAPASNWLRGRAVILAVSALLLSGCAHSLLYDESRDKQAHEAVKAVEAVRLRGAVESLEKAFADLAAREETSAAELQANLFDETLSNISAASSLGAKDSEEGEVANGLITEIEARLQVLGADESKYEQMESDADTLDAARNTLAVKLIEMHGVAGRRFASCQEIYATAEKPDAPGKVPSARFLNALRPAQREPADTIYGEMVAKCQQTDELSGKLPAAFPESEVAKYAKELRELEARLASHEIAKRKVKDELAAAVADFESRGLKPTKDMNKRSLEQLQAQAAALAGKIAHISEIQQELLPRRQVIAEETLQRLESVVAVIAGTAPDGKTNLEPEDQKAVAVVLAVPALSDEARKLFQEANKPRLVPFLAAIDRQKLLVEAFEAREKIMLKQADAARQRLVAAMSEGRALVSAYNSLTQRDKENNNDKWARQSIIALDKSLQGDDKLLLYRALGTYADDVRRFRIDTAVWNVRRLAAQHEEALAQSKYTAAQWDGLLDTMAKVLADYHAAGIKKSEIAEFIQALGLVGIGIGVAQ